MALSVTVSVTFSKTKVIVTDTTGDYDVTNNPGGYGTPNAAFADFAHYVLLRKKNVNGDADSVMTLDPSNPLTATVFEAVRSVDGWYEAKKMNITIWTAGTYAAGIVRFYNGAIYIANTSTSQTPGGANWTVVSDLTTIEDNASIIVTTEGRVTAYNADTYRAKQISQNSQKGRCGICEDDRQKQRLDKIYFHIQAVLVADQLGNNEDGEWNVRALIQLGAQ